ncbi:alanine dehydrogenase [Candidatus Aminicenantes bacterium AC-335-A11]|jgi:alanine dehydrogenase|nr:alanine dehydrogenase [SCandidatus Aminicenantes bacterium Aminicenantia_JdfR_composite]MCP2596761.1 alanine dehydrogenase [Candidatus Aminicenantes bacterium AC-335-G13]MCP2606660.1 alanine dehydrogenase [Candidatus Aminicenantes bacterium AC-708-I09]MCP2617915.1 alanine dehydrogenase [Candidatus Aminicenantes bacterium AC-335-A11]
MRIGIINESEKIENRVALIPASVSELVQKGHIVYFQSKAGERAGYSDEDYLEAGGKIVYTKEEVFGRAEIIHNISPLNDKECDLIKENTILFGFHHLAVARKKNIEKLLNKKVTVIGYEIIKNEENRLPFIEALSEVAGELCIVISGHYLQTNFGGRGIIIGGVTSVPPSTVVVIGAGVLGRSAARAAWCAGAHVIVLDEDMNLLREIEEMTSRQVITLIANRYNISRMVKVADILIGAVLIPGERAPIMVTKEMVKTMKKGSVIIDLSIDQGGCVETSRPTTLRDPIFIENGIIHYCVPNITSAVSRTSTRVLSNVLMPYLLKIAEIGPEKILKEDESLAGGVYMYRGKIVKKTLAERFGMEYYDLNELLG